MSRQSFRAPAGVQSAFERRALRLPLQARLALVVLGADELAPAPVMLRALDAAGIDGSAIQLSIDGGLVRMDAGCPRFAHPLARVAALDVATPAQRRLAHEALARAWTGNEQTAWRPSTHDDEPDTHAGARHELERAVASARGGDLARALSALGELEFRTGNWTVARALAEDALRHADQDQPFALVQLLRLAAVTGDGDGARAHAERLATIAARSGDATPLLHSTAGLGLLELSLDRPEAAIVHLTRTRAIARRRESTEPCHLQWMPDLVESQIRAGLETDALTTLQEFEARARRGHALASAARCRGLLASPETAETIFAAAHQLVAALPSPFERARTELCWGERLRRDGRRVDARRHLHDALGRFESLGAPPWAEKAARELRCSGGRAQRGPRAGAGELTAQQLQIAHMVAEGRTNKSIATSLFLSPKTIEFHLGHVYRKLDVSNRTQLTRALLTSPMH